MIEVKRYFLDLRLDKNLKISFDLLNGMKFELCEKKNFKINKFFYRQVGKDHYWRDRLIWTDKQWLNYTSNKNLDTWILKKQEYLIGFCELEQHHQKNEVELINLGVLKEYRQNGFGTSLLKHLIKFYSEKNFSRIWVHTCSLDHKHALPNYKSQGFKIFKEEKVNYVA